jgi:leader peptidase (prepilin peptidase)/N-methyltransferase
MPLGLSVVSPPSRCPSCQHQLGAIDLVPLLSFLSTGGKCRYCGAPVSWGYFRIELLTGIVFSGTIWRFGYGPNGILLCLLFAALIAAFFIDLRHFIIPDELNTAAVVIGVLRGLAGPERFSAEWAGTPDRWMRLGLLESVVGAAALSLLLWLITKGGTLMFRKQVMEQQRRWDEEGMLEEGEELEAMGLGDVKLAAAMGANLGLAGGLVALFLGVTAGALVGVALKLGRRLEGHAIPFGPYLVAGTFATMFFGARIVAWYLNVVVP